ncbi:MAG TPA: glycerate kinase, partial [Acidimicrobiales bacterium]|nr:glycerate kinase [Acidimicrobiales bacterium]
RLAQLYRERFGIDVQSIDGSGAAGGLAGGLAALGATLVSGFEVVSDRIDLAERIEGADLVLTGEGYLDEESFNGKAVGGVVELAEELGVPVVVVAGAADEDLPATTQVRAEVRTLTRTFGEARALADTAGAVSDLVADVLADFA